MLGNDFSTVLAAAQAGDQDAFAQLYRDAQPMLLRYLRVTARDLAEDIAGETWLEVIPGLGSFAGEEGGFRGWLVTIARHKLVDHRRRTGRRPELLTDTFDGPGGPASPDTADVVVEQLSTDQALALIAELPVDVAEMVALRVLLRLDVAEVADLVGRSPGAVRVAVHRGLRRLAGRLRDPAGGLAEGARPPDGVTPAAIAAFPGRDE